MSNESSVRVPASFGYVAASFGLFLVTWGSLSCAATPKDPQLSASTLSERSTKTGKRRGGQVLFLLSSADEQTLRNGKTRPTGTFLSEFYGPFEAVQARGYEAVLVTPEGKRPAWDPEGMKDGYWSDEESRRTAESWLSKSLGDEPVLSLQQVLKSPDSWDALVVPGGQGVMIDVAPDRRAHALVLALAERQRPIGLICHAPALLKYLPSEGHALSGRRVTGISPFEEFFIETFIMKSKALDRKIGRQLKHQGYRYSSALPKRDHAIADCNLVTSQNPFSGDSFLREFEGAMDRYEQGAACVSLR